MSWPLDGLIAFVRVVASSLLNGEPVFNVSAVSDFDVDADADPSKGENASEQLGHGPPGYLARPLDPDADGFAEAIALRIDGGLQPIAWRDLRLTQMLNPAGSTTPAKGQQMLVGYGGGFLSHSMTEEASGSRKANICVWYCPHDFSGRTPSKAHAIILDPSEGNSNVTVVHANGCRVTLADDTGNGPGILLSVDGQTFARMTAGEFSVSAARILLKGNVYLGANAEAGLPLLAGAASPPSASVFVSSPT